MLTSKRHAGIVGASLFALGLLTWAGCNGITPGPTDNTGGDTGGNPTGGKLIVRFKSPASPIDLADNQQTMIKYDVIASGPTTVKLMLDVNLNPSDKNESDVAPLRTFSQNAASDEVPLVGDRYPYGTYWVRATISDGTNEATYLAAAPVRIVPSTLGGDDVSQVDLTGQTIVFDAGTPQQIDGRVPFADLWHELDVADNLAPRAIMPIAITQKTEVKTVQFFAYGRPEQREYRVEFYRNTNPDSQGTLMEQRDFRATASFGGKWITATIDPPLVLEPGSYGVSVHSRWEFTSRIAGNSPNGSGYVWLSAFGGAPYQKIDSTELGFTPNFAVRMYGKNSGPSRAKPAEPPADLKLLYRNGDEAQATLPAEDTAEELLPLHVSYREVMPNP